MSLIFRAPYSNVAMYSDTTAWWMVPRDRRANNWPAPFSPAPYACDLHPSPVSTLYSLLL